MYLNDFDLPQAMHGVEAWLFRVALTAQGRVTIDSRKRRVFLGIFFTEQRAGRIISCNILPCQRWKNLIKKVYFDNQ